MRRGMTIMGTISMILLVMGLLSMGIVWDLTRQYEEPTKAYDTWADDIASLEEFDNIYGGTDSVEDNDTVYAWKVWREQDVR